MNIININDTSGKLFYIGGVVRDEILGFSSFDVDITYVGDAVEFAKGIENAEIIQINESFGTVKIKINGQEIDIASTRSEIYPNKGHLPLVEKIGCSLKEDVMRRDFTINAMAKSLKTGEIVDYTGGLKDIKNKKLRVLHDKSFIDDPTRILRGLKFSVRFNFELDEHTKKLQEEYLNNINYDMSYKRLKKELIETFNLNKQNAFEKFINEKIYKLVTPNDVSFPKKNIENLVNKYLKDKNYVWLVYVGVLQDLTRLPLTKTEQKIIDDIPKTRLYSDFEIYKAFESLRPESILLYAILYDESVAIRYFDYLSKIKTEICGQDLINLGYKPSPRFQEIFDEVLRQKLQNPNITKEDEIAICQKFHLL